MKSDGYRGKHALDTKATQTVRSCRAQSRRCEASGNPASQGLGNGERGDQEGGGGHAEARPQAMKWLREAISDVDGLADMAYLAIGSLTVSAICSLIYIMVMATVSYIRCTHIVDVGQNTRASIACTFDPLPVGQAAGLIFGAFAALIGALAGYMAATRRAAQRTADKV